MKRLLVYLFFLILAICCGILIKIYGSGYVLVAYNQWTAEMPLWFAIVGWTLLFFIIYFILRVMNVVSFYSEKWHILLKHRRVNRSYRLTGRGLLALMDHSWRQAEKLLKKGVEHNSMPEINYLGIAYAAHQQGESAKRDQYFAKVSRLDSFQERVNVLQAQLHLDQQQPELALAALLRLKKSQRNHPRALSSLCDAYFKLRDWKNVMALLPRLKKEGGVSEQTFSECAFEVYQKRLKQVKKESGEVQKVWNDIPHSFRDNPRLVAVYAQALIQNGKANEASGLIEKALKKEWNRELLFLYGEIETSFPEKQLQWGEKRLKENKEDAALLRTLGRLAARLKYWGKAKDYFLSSLRREETIQTYVLLAGVYEEMGENGQALQMYKSAYKNII